MLKRVTLGSCGRILFPQGEYLIPINSMYCTLSVTNLQSHGFVYHLESRLHDGGKQIFFNCNLRHIVFVFELSLFMNMIIVPHIFLP